MRRATALPKPPAGQPIPEIHILLTLRTLLPYLWQYRLRVVAALSCLVAAKLANVSVPIIFKEMIDGLSPGSQALALPVLLLALYGVLRFANSLFTELREILFARVTQRAVRQVALEVFRHLHSLSLRFHLERQTGGVSRDVERGTRSISSLISYTLYSILPTLVEIGLVLAILLVKYDMGYVVITGISLISYLILQSKSATGGSTSDARLMKTTQQPTPAPSIACSTMRRSNTSTTKPGKPGVTTNNWSNGRMPQPVAKPRSPSSTSASKRLLHWASRP